MASLNQAKIIEALEAILDKACHNEFIYDFLLAFDTPKATISRAKAASQGQELVIPQKIYFKELEKGTDLTTELEQVIADPKLEKNKIRFVMLTNFESIAAYDRKVKDTVIFDFVDLKSNYEFFLPLTGKYEKTIEHSAHPADVKACEKMGKLYDSICQINNYEKHQLHTINVFLTRLLFCFFAEDTGIFTKASQMTHAIKSNTLEDGSDLTDFFEKLFLVLSLPPTAPERRELTVTFQSFPYVNGGLFLEQIIIPKFNSRSRKLLLECGLLEWKEISPVIFGSMFQAVMDTEHRRSMGAHYTSEKNILKVLRPLFLDALQEEFQQILQKKQKKKEALIDFQAKLGSLGFLDPACGCGNFLIVAYRELKNLE